MKIPKALKSQGIVWVVRYNDDIEPLGVTDYDKKEIVIRKSLPQELKEATFLHEIFHTFNTTVDHALVDSLAMQLYQTLKENKLIK